jgi:serine/threonine-protein kinase
MLKALLLAAASLIASLNWLTYTDPKGQFNVSYPETWELNVSDNVVTFFSPLESDSDQFRENVNVMVQDLSEQPTTMAEYTEGTKTWVREGGGVLQLEREIKLAGETATEVAYTMPGKSLGMDMDVMFHQVWILKNNKAYLMTYAARPESYATFEEMGAGIFKSFKLGK